MPTLISEPADTLDLDYFYSKCKNSYSIALFESEKKSHIRPIPPTKAPSTCLTKTTRATNKMTHFFPAPPSTATVKCLCNKYHTKFVSNLNNTYQLYTDFSVIRTGKSANSQDLDKTATLINQISNTTENIPPSPTPQTCHHQCPQCSLTISCKFYNDRHHPTENYQLINEEVYHTNCANTLTSSSKMPRQLS